MTRIVRKLFTLRKITMAATMFVTLGCGLLWLAGSGILESTDGQLASNDVASPPRINPRTEDKRLSEAEYLARLQRAIEADEKQIASIKAQEDDPQSEYRKAEAEFKVLDAKRDELRARLLELRHAGKDREADRVEAEAAEFNGQWQAAKERFDLAIQTRKILREQVASLQQKRTKDLQALEALTGVPASEAAEGPQSPLPAADAAAAQASAPAEPTPGSQAAPPVAAAEVAEESASASGSPSSPPAASAPPAGASAEAKPEREAVVKAQEVARAKQAAAEEAKHRAATVNERYEALRKSIAVEQQLLDLARAKVDQTQAAWETLDKELQKKLEEDPSDLEDVSRRLGEAGQRFSKARSESRAILNRLEDLRAQLATLQEEQLEATQDAERTTAEAKAAAAQLATLQNPFSPDNIMQWLLDHAPKLFVILFSTLCLYLVVRVSGQQIATMMARTGSRGTRLDRENRALTLVSVFRNAASLSIFGGGTLMALDEVGIPIMPLMGGAAVLGLAVAFGAQNLVRDYFSGFMVLMEDQYGINDVVRIGDISGVVEKITLRITVLRDLEGIVHFIPHGNITRVSNMSHGWSRAVVDVPIGYQEDPDRVMPILVEIAKELRKDPAFGPLILDDPEMLGVDSFTDSAVMLKFILKTHPLKRSSVKRELLRRIKRRFTELGIEIPTPQRTVYMRHETEAAAGEAQPIRRLNRIA